jgi:hypothetical protein
MLSSKEECFMPYNATPFGHASRTLNGAQLAVAGKNLITEKEGVKVTTRFDLSESRSEVSLIAKILASIEATGGVTIDRNGNVPKEGFAVGGRSAEGVFPAPVTYNQVKRFILTNLELLASPNEDGTLNYFGAWSHEGKVYLDIVTVTTEDLHAIFLAGIRKQLAVWDLKNEKEILL